MINGIIFDIKEFAVHDGPGIRTTVFMKGCPLKCLWCHNPEGMGKYPQLMITESGCLHCGKCRKPCMHPECKPFNRCIKACPKGLVKIAGSQVDASALAKDLRDQILFFEGGGVTISGGEPTMQPEFLFELLDGLSGVHTIVETCGHTTEEVFGKVVEKASMIYLDIKHMDSSIHKKLTGMDNEQIQKNLSFLLAQNKQFIIRMPLIPGINDDKENLKALARRLSGAPALRRVEFLPFNPFTGAKYAMAGMEFKLQSVSKIAYEPVIPEDEFNRAGIKYQIL